jgi:hypothetical protein
LSAGRRAEIALLVYALKMGSGIDLGRYRPGGVLTKAGQEHFAPSGGRALQDEADLTVFQDVSGTVFVGFDARGSVARSTGRFRELIAESYGGDEQTDSKLALALELFSMSRLENSPRSRLVTLATAIEAILDRKPRSAASQALIAALIETTRKSSLARNERESLVAALSGLRHESIGKAGRSLVQALLGEKEYNGKRPAAFFQRLYALRSTLVHKGRVEPSAELYGHANTAEVFVKDLIRCRLQNPRLQLREPSKPAGAVKRFSAHLGRWLASFGVRLVEWAEGPS